MNTGMEKMAAGQDVSAQAKTIESLLKAKRLHQFSSSPEFQTLLSRLAEVAGDTNAKDRLLATSLLCKIGTLVKAHRLEVGRVITDGLEHPLQALDNLPDPDDRYYLATFWRFFRPEWTDRYLATAAVYEEGSEPVRKECIQGLLSGSESLRSTIDLLAAEMKRLTFDTASPARSKARRLRRLLGAVRASFVVSFKEPGEKIGTSFRSLLRDTFDKVGVPEPLRVQEELAEESIALVHEIIRARFVFATSSDTYVSINTIVDWFSPGDWNDFVGRSAVAPLLARDIEEGIELLARAGIPDTGLFRFLTIITGGEREARKRLMLISNRNPALPEEMTAWLQGREIKRKSPLAAESQAAQVDEGLSTLLLETVASLEAVDYVKREVLPKMRVLGSEYATHLESLVARLSTITNAIGILAASRSLRVSGEVGTVVEFSPLQHELTESAHFGARKVRILRPAIIAPSGDDSYRVVRKALVERA